MHQILTREEAESVLSQIEACRVTGGFLQSKVGPVDVAETFDGEFLIEARGRREVHRSSQDLAAAYGLQAMQPGA